MKFIELRLPIEAGEHNMHTDSEDLGDSVSFSDLLIYFSVFFFFFIILFRKSVCTPGAVGCISACREVCGKEEVALQLLQV